MEQNQKMIKDLGLQQFVMDSYPYAVVSGTWMGSFEVGIDGAAVQAVLNHIVPAGQQLKMLFLRVWTQSSQGAKFIIVQTNPAAVGTTGAIEAYPVVGSVPPYVAGGNAIRDYPMLEAAGAEILRGGLVDPVHVFEGSIEFRIMGPVLATGDRYCIAWSGVEKIPQ